MPPLDNRGAAGHPVSWAACALIVLNDFVLRPRLDNWWTGKLSDVAWLVIVPLVLVAVLAPRSRTWGPRLGALTLTAAIYTTLQLWEPLGAFVSAAHVADVGDLVVLPALLIPALIWSQHRRALAPMLAVPVMIVALVADSSSALPKDTTYPCGEPAIWPSNQALRFRMHGVADPESDIFLRGIQLSDEHGEDVPFIVAEDPDSYVVCPRDGFAPETTYYFDVGPFESSPGHEIPVESDMDQHISFQTDGQEGIPVSDGADCLDLAPTPPDDTTCNWNADPTNDTGYTG